MHVPYEVPRISVRDASAASLDADLIIIPVAQDHLSEAVAAFDGAVSGELSSAANRGEFKGKAYDTCTLTTTGWKAPRVMFVGGGHRRDMAVERFRRMAATALKSSRQQRRARIAWVDVEHGTLDAPARLESIAEGFTLGNFDNGVYKSKDDTRFFVNEATLAASGAMSGDAQAGVVFGESINAARVLVNEPGNYLTPTHFAERAASLASVPGITAEILEPKRLEELGMGLLLGVARGSSEPPRLLVLKYEPKGAPASQTLGLVGKGITFDTGGISLKPADGMERMKDDMAGGAAVVAAIRSIALQKLPVRTIAVVPTTENMPGGKAIKPGDILRGAAGITVEVNNTDAEGRLILGDGLWYARELGATHLIDVATLTGAVVVALGKITTGLYGTPQPWVDHIRAAADRAGEKLWHMPLFDEYKDSLKSEIADMLNSPGRPGGSITAAMFLKEFAGEGPWAHLDIAGTAWAEESKPYQPKGATGTMIRTLIDVARAGLPK